MKHLKLFEKKVIRLKYDHTMSYQLEFHTTTHSIGRQSGTRSDIEGYDSRPVSNPEIAELAHHFRKPIVERLVSGLIYNKREFVVKSREKDLSMVLITIKNSEFYWEFLVKTIFRESETLSIRIPTGQLVITDSDIN